MQPRITGKMICRKYGLTAAHSLYREDGTWYHVLRDFPGILFDKNGFVRFIDYEEFSQCEDIKVYPEKDQLAVPKGINSIAGYTTFASLSATK